MGFYWTLKHSRQEADECRKMISKFKGCPTCWFYSIRNSSLRVRSQMRRSASSLSSSTIRL